MAYTLPGGAISNLYAVAVARFKAEPRSKQQGMTSLSSRLVMFASEHVSNDVIIKTTCISRSPDIMSKAFYFAVVLF